MTRSLFTTAAGLAVLNLGVATSAPEPTPDGPAFLIVNGAAGESTYAEVFAAQVAAWKKAAGALGAHTVAIGAETPEAKPDRELLQQAIAALPPTGASPVWIVLIGHGTFDKQEARFNLRGDDVTASELAAWLQPVDRPIAVINTTSASAPFIAKLSGPRRIVVTATRSGSEQNYTRFGTAFAAVLDDPAADLDQDGRISLLEAFLGASAKVTEFYKGEGRLATEHALIDDTGDGLGTPAAWFRGLRATKSPKAGVSVDGTRAHQWSLSPDTASAGQSPEWRAQRDTLEAAVTALREQKATLPEAEYLRRLESALVELARHYQTGPGFETPPNPTAGQ